jgi:hypothetical protein
MKRTAQAIALVLLIVVASVLLTRLWLTHPEIFPEFPKPIAEYLATLYGAQNAEDIADLEILVGLSMSVPIVSAFTFLAWFVWHNKR